MLFKMILPLKSDFRLLLMITNKTPSIAIAKLDKTAITVPEPEMSLKTPYKMPKLIRENPYNLILTKFQLSIRYKTELPFLISLY